MVVRSLTFLFLLPVLGITSQAQELTIDRVEPPSWWTGFRNPRVQLLVHGDNIGAANPSVYYPGVTLERAHVMNNRNYLFLDMLISGNALPGSVPIVFSVNGKKVAEYLFDLREREPGSAERSGFGPSDVICLLMPDRFANGDTSNDRAAGMKELPDRRNPDGRHGGDLRGISESLDYFSRMGFTALWMTPVLENNMEKYSYHGYACTDYYRIDPRFGTNEQYRELSISLHRNGLKLIMDMVPNHCGSGHWWMTDLPAEDWVSRFPEFTRTSYRAATVNDPHVSGYDSSRFIAGWFDKSMPDLNQRNPYLSTYLIQNAIWWVEYAGLDGIRIDTYPYPFRDFMARFDRAILEEYPRLNIVGECWLTSPGGIACWQKDAKNADGFNTFLPAVFDFAMYDAIRMGLNENDGWNNGSGRLYDILSQDYLYPDPSNILVFADNHDVDRFLGAHGQDTRKLKMALAIVLTCRGIPQIFYGTELLLTTKGEHKGDGYKRADFPGGWPGDSTNGFTWAGLTPEQEEMSSYLQKLMTWRKNKPVIHNGKLTHFIPEGGLYVWFRHNEKETVMVAINNKETGEIIIDRTRYGEFLGRFNSATDIVTGKDLPDLSGITVPAKSVLILEMHP